MKFNGFLSRIGLGIRRTPALLQNPKLDEGYRAMAADTQYENDANEWIEGLISDLAYESR
jgi:hypothetical protein